MKSTITEEQRKAIAAQLEGRQLCSGVGTKESQCSIAAINLALYNRLTDEIPDCMSQVIGVWIIVIQDVMPQELRNSAGWRELLPRAAGTGRDFDQEERRLAIILDWMWTALARAQPRADAYEFGDEWATMCRERTAEAAQAVAQAGAWHCVTQAAAQAARASKSAQAAGAWQCVAQATRATTVAAAWDWHHIDPVGLLEQLIEA